MWPSRSGTCSSCWPPRRGPQRGTASRDEADGGDATPAAADGGTTATSTAGPTAGELVEAVGEFLSGTVMPATAGAVAFHARVAANVLAVVERQLALGPAHAVAHREPPRRAWASASTRELCRGHRRRPVRPARRATQLWASLAGSARDRLAVANPRHLALPRPQGAPTVDFDLPADLAAYLDELDRFIEDEIRPLEQQDDNIRFFDHRREDARTDWDRGGLPSEEWEALLGEMRRRADAAGHYRYAFPKEYGGRDGTNLGMAVIREHLARKGLGLHNDLQNESSIVGNNVGLLLMLEYGTDEQKAEWVDDLAAGRTGFAFGITEPDHGSDATHMETTARARRRRAGSSPARRRGTPASTRRPTT